MRYTKNMKKYGQRCWAPLFKKNEGTLDYSYPLTVGKEIAAKGWKELGKESLVGEREELFAEKKFEGRVLELESEWIDKPLYNNRIWNHDSLRTNCSENIALEISCNKMAEQMLGGSDDVLSVYKCLIYIYICIYFKNSHPHISLCNFADADVNIR